MIGICCVTPLNMTMRSVVNSSYDHRLFVEGKTDCWFIKGFLEHVFQDVPLDISNCNSRKGKKKAFSVNKDQIVLKIIPIDGIGNLEEALLKVLKDPKNRVNAGVILDANHEGIPSRLNVINHAVKKIFGDQERLANQNGRISMDHETVILSAHILNLGGGGELEDVLRRIANQETYGTGYADCLESWFQCIEAKGKTLPEKEKNKLWLQLYARYDACNKGQESSAEKNCDDESVLQKHSAWNYDHESLRELRDYLEHFFSMTN